ncbi:MAG: hypothetical protein ACXVFC_09955 [Gaiellaceae bacterium]
MLNRGEPTVLPFPKRRPAFSAGQSQSSPGAAVDELERLRKRVHQHEHALARLSDALLTLRRGGQALREENRELRLELEAARRARGHQRIGPLR